MTLARLRPAILLAGLMVAGCSSLSAKKEEAPKDPNTFPANYRTQIAQFLRQSLANRSDFRGAQISPPTLKQVGDNQRYVVCLMFNPGSQIKPKVAIYFGGLVSQFVDSTPDQCAGAAYAPFKELEAAVPPT